MKVYSMILETSEQIFRHIGVYKNKKDALSVPLTNNANCHKMIDVTKDYLVNLSRLEEVLLKNGYGEIETELIISVLQDETKNFYR